MAVSTLIPWTKLTRGGMPEFQVCRFSLTVAGNTLTPGDRVSVDHFPNRTRLRQLYEQRRVAVVGSPLNSVAAMNDATARAVVRNSRQGRGQGEVAAVVVKQAARAAKRVAVADSAFDSDLPVSVSVPAAETDVFVRSGSSGYRPKKQVK